MKGVKERKVGPALGIESVCLVIAGEGGRVGGGEKGDGEKVAIDATGEGEGDAVLTLVGAGWLC